MPTVLRLRRMRQCQASDFGTIDPTMFSASAAYYDLLYSFKDYAAEANRVRSLIDAAKQSRGRRLLDVACGTGQHLRHFIQHFDAEGLDLDPELLAIAQCRLPDLRFTQADMADFDLGRTFDAIVCLFSSIGYVGSRDRLQLTARNLVHHLEPGGVVLVEPWLTPDAFEPGHVHALLAEAPDLKVARMSSSELREDRWLLNFYYLVGSPTGVEHFTEQHRLGLFTTDDYLAAFRGAGLMVTYDPGGLSGRGLLVGVKPVA